MRFWLHFLFGQIIFSVVGGSIVVVMSRIVIINFRGKSGEIINFTNM